MIAARTVTVVVLALALSAVAVQGQEQGRYRDFQLGSDLPSVAALTGVSLYEARTIHQRPAVIQQLEWRLPYVLSGSTAAVNDPVHQIVFSFFDNQLSKMVIDYDRGRTAGMTDADLIEALSASYGPPLKPAVKKTGVVVSQFEDDSGTPVARWGGADYAVVLYRSSYLAGLRLIVSSPRLVALARTADAQAIRLDDREAPQREIARQKKEAEDTRVSQEKARAANKAAFRP